MTELRKVEEGDIDLQKWYEQRDDVKALCRDCMNGALKSDQLAVQTSRLIEQTNTIIDALINDTAGLARTLTDLQQQQNNVGMQAFLALEVLKSKGLATAEEINAVYLDVMKSQVEQMQAAAKAAAAQASPVVDPNEPVPQPERLVDLDDEGGVVVPFTQK